MKIKENIIILAEATQQEDLEFLNLLLEPRTHLSEKALIIFFNTVENFDCFIQQCNKDFKFKLFVHVSKLVRVSPGQARTRFEDLLRNLPYFDNLNYYYTSRAGDSLIEGKQVLHTQKMLVKDFSFAEFESNTIADLFEPSGIIKNDLEQERHFEFAILSALYKDEFAVYEEACELNPNTKILNSFRAKFNVLKKKKFPSDYDKDFLVIHQQKMGLVDAAIHATQTIHHAKPDFFIMSGVCGGREGVVNQYDIIIPTIVHDYSTGKFKEGKFESLNYKSNLSEKLKTLLENKKDDIITNMRLLIDPSRKKLLNEKFNIHIDEFACGPWVVKTNGFMDEEIVGKISEKIKGLEMESYSILRTGETIQNQNCFSLVVKSVMDFTNEYKNDGQFGEVKSGAAYVSYLCTRAMMPILSEFKKNNETWQ